MIEYENLGKLNQPFFQEYQYEFEKVLKSGWYVLGGQVSSFEAEFSTFLGGNYFVGLASGLDALDIALRIFKFKKGSEVIVPSNTYIATILAVIENGLVPILVEPNISTYNIDPDKVEQAVTSKTVAIIPVHLYGKCCQMDRILEISKRHDLKIIEDAAQAHGAKFKGVCAGNFGELAAFSFYPTKNLGALGDAGGLMCSNAELAESTKMLRNYGSNIKYYNEVVGLNSRLDEVQAAFLRVKLRSLDVIINHKRELANLYLSNIDGDFILPTIDEDYFDVYHIFNIRHPKRDRLRDFLLKNDIKTEIHYPVPPHKQKALKGEILGDFKISDEIHSTTLSLPISYFHQKSDISKVIEVLNRFE